MSAPGRRIGSGHLRVDARRAVAKLREYQLPDPLQWILEVTRGVVGLGATAIDVRADTDDVWIRWTGPTLPDEELAGLLDELVSPSPTRERRPVRLLAIGVNTALGLEPRWVDVYRLDEGVATRVRYTGQLFEVAKDDDAGPALTPTRVDVPLGATESGGAVHVRRRPGFEMFGRFLRGGLPPEVQLLAGAAEDPAVPVTILGRTQTRETSHGDLLRVPLPPPYEGFVSLRDPEFGGLMHGVRIDLAEYGVVLQQLTASFFDVPAGKSPVPVPVRLFFDAERLPTNASRSLVRTDEAPVRDVLLLAEPMLEELVAAACERLSDDALEASYRARLRTSLLQLVACFVRGRWRFSRMHLPSVFAPLRELPLLRDAIGRPRSLDSFQELGPAVVHDGREPVEEELEAALGEVLWVPPGDAAGLLLDDHTPRGTRKAVKEARKQLAARERFLRHEVRAPSIPDADRQLISIQFGPGHKRPKTGLPDKLWSDLVGVGEVVLLDPGGIGGKRAGIGVITVLLEGRPIVEASVEASWPFEAVVTSEHLVPTTEYDGVLHDATFTGVVQAAQASALLAIEELAGVLLKPDRDLHKSVRLRTSLPALQAKATRYHALFRAAQHAHVAAADALSTQRLRGYLQQSPLGRLPVWSIVDHEGACERPLRELHRTFASQTLLQMPHDSDASPPAGHTGLRVGSRDLALLPLLFREITLLEYAPRRPADWTRNMRGSWSPVRLHWEDGPHRRGCIGWSRRESSSVTWMHRGHPLGSAETFDAAGQAVDLWVDDDRLVPTPGWDGVALEPTHLLDERGRAWDLVCALIDHLSGQEVPGFVVHASGLDKDRALHLELFRAVAARKGFRRALGKERWARFASLPIVPRVDGFGSLTELTPPRGGLKYLTPSDALLGLDLGDWNPVFCAPELAEVLGRLVNRKAHHAVDQIAAMRQEALRERNRAAHFAQAQVTLPPTGDEAIQLSDRGLTLALPHARTEETVITVRVEDRPFTEIVRQDSVPLRATISVGTGDVDEEFARLRKDAVDRIVGRVERAAHRLAAHVARAEPTKVVSDPRLRALVLAITTPKKSRRKAGAKKLRALLCEDLAVFETLQGARVPLLQATTRTRIRVARYDGEWLGPAEGESEHILDRPIVRLPAEDTGEFITLLEQVADPRTIFRHTRAARELQSERRLLQGVATRPSLGYRPEVTAPFEELVKDRRSLRGIGYGEIALAPHDDAQLQVVSSVSGATATIPLALDVPVVAITEMPTLAEDAKKGLNSKDRDRITAKVRKLGEALLRKKILPHLEALPIEARRHVRLGLLHFWISESEANRAPLFLTTAGDWVSLADCQEQAKKFGSLWCTTAKGYVDAHRVPLDPARFAVRLDSASEMGALSGFCVVKDAAEELRLDDEARKNKGRAKHGSVALRDEVRREALHVFSLKKPEAEVAILERGGRGIVTGVMLLRDRLPLGIVDPGFDWPILAKLDEPKLTPTRTWDGAVDDEVKRQALATVRKKVEASLREMVGDVPKDALVSGRLAKDRLRDELEAGGAARGRFWLTEDLGPGHLRIAGAQSMVVEPTYGGALPVHGRVLTSARSFRRRDGAHRLAQAAYRTLLTALARRVKRGDFQGATEAAAIAHLVRGVILGWKPEPAHEKIVVPCVLPQPFTLKQLPVLLAAAGVPMLDEGDDPPRVGFALLADGSPCAQVLADRLGHRLRPNVEPLVAFDEAEETEAPAPSSSKRTWSKGKKRKRIPKVEEHALAPLARHLQRQLHALGLAHVVSEVSVARRRKKVLVTYHEATRTMSISGEHPLLISLQAARLTRKEDAERGMRVLTAHAVGVLNRILTSVTDAQERGVLLLLLEP